MLLKNHPGDKWRGRQGQSASAEASSQARHFPTLFLVHIISANETTALSISRRSEHKVWSPLVTEEGKRHPYKMNLASEPQVSTCSPLPLL